MKRQNVLKAKKLAQEFTAAVDDLIKESDENIPDWYKERHPRSNDYIYDGAKSGLVRHWSVILTRALANMRNS